MRIQDFDSVHELTTPLQIESALSKRHAGINSFWLSHGTELFPYINIMVNGDLAYVHYFPEEHHPGYASVGGSLNLRPGGITNFFHNPSDEPFDVMNETVVPFSKALKAAKEFAVSKALPKCLAWNSLVL